MQDKRKNGIWLNRRWSEAVDRLTDEQAGQVFKSLLAMKAGGDEPKDPSASVTFLLLKSSIEEDNDAREKISKMRSDAALKRVEMYRAGKLGRAEAPAEKAEPQKPAKAVKAAKPQFIIPTVDEVRDYCEERRNNVDPESFVDFYSSKGWKIGKNPMKDWKAAVRTWERNDYGSSRKQNPQSTHDYLMSVINGGAL